MNTIATYKKGIYKNCKPIAITHITNTFGIALFECTDDYVVSAFYDIYKGYTDFRKTKTKGLEYIEYAYFTRYGINYKLQDFIRVNY